MMEVDKQLGTELNCNELCSVEEKKEASNDTEIRPCAKTDVMDVCDELVTSVDGKETRDGLDTMQFACSTENQTAEILKNNGLRPCLENHMEETVTVLKPCSLQDKKVENSSELANKVAGEKEIEPYEIVNDGELEPCANNHALDVFSNSNSEPCALSKVKEASNEDMYSEVSNPNPSPKNGTSNLTISSQVVDVLGVDHGGCGEITSAYSKKKLEPVSTSCVVLEIPKHISTTGVTKITLKCSKRKEEYANEIPVVVKHPAHYNFHEGYYENPVSVDGDHPLTRAHQELSSYRDVEMNLSVNCSELNDSNSPTSYLPKREIKMFKKISADDYPNNVKKLLATRILDGARVKYISKTREKELQGIIKDGGYLCGCPRCNFSKIVSAYEFELHAGTKTRHPNNHIFLENGKPVYKIIEGMKSAPLSTIDDVIKSVAGSSINEEYFQVWQANLQGGNSLAYVDDLHRRKRSGTYPSSVGYTSHPTEDTPYPASCHYSQFIPVRQQSYLEASTERKRFVKKPRNACSNSSWEHKKAFEGGTKKRDNDLHKMLFMPNGLPDGTELAYYAKGKKILGGYKQRSGILCSCCDTEISPSQFESHAGWAAKRQPYRHIYTSSGLALHDIALMLANGQKLMTSGHDDMCAICGDGKELVTCQGCPRAFHAACLGLKCLPEVDWCCSHCRDKFGAGGKASGALRPIMMRFSRASKEPEFETGGCVICRSQEFSAATFDDKTVILCDQCEKEYHVGCLRDSGMCDLKELPDDKWFCCGDCNKIFVTLQNLASGRAEVIPTPVSSALQKKHTAIGLNDGSNNEIEWRILSGKSRFPEQLFLLSRAAEIFRECFDPIIAASGRDLIPVMVYGRNISGQEFSGMYCVVLTVKSVVVSAALIRIFGREAAELPLVATRRENQGKGYFQALFSCIEGFLLSISVKRLVLPAAEEAEPMWTKKLGFTKLSTDQMQKYTRDLQLTMFKGSSLLEKKVQQE